MPEVFVILAYTCVYFSDSQGKSTSATDSYPEGPPCTHPIKWPDEYESFLSAAYIA